MKLRYYPDTDSLYIDLADRPGADSREVTPGVVAAWSASISIRPVATSTSPDWKRGVCRWRPWARGEPAVGGRREAQ
jgi:hypothetical protein